MEVVALVKTLVAIVVGAILLYLGVKILLGAL